MDKAKIKKLILCCMIAWYPCVFIYQASFWPWNWGPAEFPHPPWMEEVFDKAVHDSPKDLDSWIVELNATPRLNTYHHIHYTFTLHHSKEGDSLVASPPRGHYWDYKSSLIERIIFLDFDKVDYYFWDGIIGDKDSIYNFWSIEEKPDWY